MKWGEPLGIWFLISIDAVASGTDTEAVLFQLWPALEQQPVGL